MFYNLTDSPQCKSEHQPLILKLMPKQITGDEPANILTIRQEFSARAMQGILAGYESLTINDKEKQQEHWRVKYFDVTSVRKIITKEAIEQADALIAELNKQL